MNEQAVRTQALALYFRRVAVLLGCGVSLLRTLELVGETTADQTLRQVNEEVVRRIVAGQTLSGCMADHPQVFSRVCVAMVRAGEVGGILDETAHRLAGYLEGEAEIRESLRLRYEVACLRDAEEGVDVERRVQEAIEGTRGRVTQGLFWRAFGEMLGAGVPLGTALDCAAEIYEGEERERVCRVAEGLEPGTALTPAMEATGLFSGASLQLCSIGEQTGTLDMTAQKAADYLEAETRTAGWLTEDAATQASRPGTGRATPDRRR